MSSVGSDDSIASLEASPMIVLESPKAAAKGASPKSWSAHWSSTGSADSAAAASSVGSDNSIASSAASLKASPKAVSAKGALESPRAVAMQKALYPSSSASSKGASVKASSSASSIASADSVASPVAAHVVALPSSKGAKAGVSAVVGVSPRALALHEALYPSLSASPKASPKGASAKGAAAAAVPVVALPPPTSRPSLPALRQMLAQTTEIALARKAALIRAGQSAKSARINKSSSANEKTKEVLSALSNFKDAKNMVERISAKIAAAEAAAGVGAAAKGVKGAAAKGVKGAAAKGAKEAAAKTISPKAAAAVAPSPVAAAPVILNVSPRHKWSSSSDGSRKEKPKINFSINPLAKAASPKAASLLGVSPKGNSPNLVNWDTNVLIQQDFPIGSQDWGESPKAKASSASLWGESPEAAPAAPMVVVASPKAAAAGRKAKVMLLSEMQDDIAEFKKENLKAHVVKGMRGQKSRKRSNPLLDLEKQLKEGIKKPKRLERYNRLIAEGRRREAIQYMRKHNMLHEVMDMSHVVPVEDIGLDVVDIEQPSPSSKKGAPLGLRAQIKEPFVDLNLEVVNIDQPSPSSKKRSSSGSRKRANAKPISSPHSRKVDKGASFGKMAEALEKKAKQDAKQVVPFKPAPFVPKSTYVVGVRGASAGKKGDKTVDALHKERVNRAISPTFRPYDQTKGDWM